MPKSEWATQSLTFLPVWQPTNTNNFFFLHTICLYNKLVISSSFLGELLTSTRQKVAAWSTMQIVIAMLVMAYLVATFKLKFFLLC